MKDRGRFSVFVSGKSAACTARDVEEKVNWPNGPREAGQDHAVPYKSGILDCKIGAALCSRAGLPMRFSGGYVLI